MTAATEEAQWDET